MARRFPKEVHEWMAAYIPGHTDREIQEALFRELGVEMTLSGVHSYKTNHHIPSGTRCGYAKRQWCPVVTDEILEFMQANAFGHSRQELTDMINEHFGLQLRLGQVIGAMKRYHIFTGFNGRFEKGNVPPNKGKKIDPENLPEEWRRATFHKGHVPHNTVPIGTVLKKDDGYLWKKIQDSPPKWRQLHRLMWEEERGPIPAGSVLIFLDGNRENVCMENLKLISRSAHAVCIRKKLRSEDAEITDAGTSLAELIVAVNKRRRKKRETDIHDSAAADHQEKQPADPAE